MARKASLYVIAVTMVAAIGGLIFGFDTAIVTGILLAYFVNWVFAGSGPSNWPSSSR